MEETSSLVVFQGNSIRRTRHNNEWWFSVIDIIVILTDSNDPKQYIKKMRSRDPLLNANWGTICTPLELIAPDGRKRETNCVNTEGAFRLIQSIPSPKAEPLKLWLAKRVMMGLTFLTSLLSCGNQLLNYAPQNLITTNFKYQLITIVTT
ncbi:MAG TPA: Bro-N domain-containing protein [Candidatus Nanoarchaeia archaeon]|nr:Bro-N domain-containing protein [Candidatus Nanoarchaeia archaeon]